MGEVVEQAIVIFLFVSVIVMVLMACVTRSLGGAFIGFAVVCFGTTMLLFQIGGLAIVGGIILLPFALMSLVAAFGLGANYSHSSLTRIDHDGTRWEATQNLWGEGAKNSTSQANWNALGSGDSPRLGDGK